jgi:predicted RNA binding protein YcfA (HicA-like mRNA interferase family)
VDDECKRCTQLEEADVRGVKVREVIRFIESYGWYLVAMRGSHRQYKHPVTPGRVTVAGNPRTNWRRAH